MPTSAILGQALDFSVEVRLDPGEVLEPSCIGAEVLIGERRLPAPAVRSAIVRQATGSALVRVVTTVPVDEPVVDVSLGVGCVARVTRRFVLFADPPAITPLAAAVPVAAAPAVPAAVAAASAPAQQTRSSPDTTPAAAPSEPATPPGGPQRRSETRRVASGPAAAPAARPPARAATTPARPAAARPAPARQAAAAPRLKVDVLEPAPRQAVAPSAAVVEEAIAAVQAAASAARAAADAASQSAARIQALEQDVARLQRESRARDAEAAELRQRVAAAERASDLTTPLLLAALALLGLAGWLAWRLRSVQAERERSWREAADAAVSAHGPASVGPPTGATSPIPMVNSVLDTEGASSTSAIAATARPRPPAPVEEIDLFATGSPALASGPPTLPAEPITERTVVLPVPGAETVRDVSIEELIDLEQQADFFVVLGQDEAAIDLLIEHLRQSGGSSPLPYLKLLEIHRRRDERREYERIRDRFNNRFNAYAPDWDTDLQHGRSLEDYAGVLPRLQTVWPRPLDAMAELEALLFRRSRGELFDLPAYRDVLMLYAVARDLNERDGGSASDIDLLLPLADGGEFSATAATPLSLPELRGGAPATVPGGIDLDLTDSSGERGIFIDSQRGRPT